MLRIDRAVTPTMAKAPTLGAWELELLRTIENVVRLGHLTSVSRGRLELSGGSVSIADDALVVNCAADGLKNPPLVPIWQPSAITLQPVRAGFPCFGAALAGYVEATRSDDSVKNSAVPPLVVRQLADRLGPDEHPGPPEHARRSTPSPTSRTGPTGSRSTPPGCRPSRTRVGAAGRRAAAGAGAFGGRDP